MILLLFLFTLFIHMNYNLIYSGVHMSFGKAKILSWDVNVLKLVLTIISFSDNS